MTAAAAGPGPLWDCFVVISLPQSLRTVQGEAGFLGSDHRYQPDVVDSLPFPLKDATRPPPPHVATCCLPGGVDIVLQQDLATAALTPRTFSVVLTEGNGTNVYASCLTFYDHVPHELSARHEDLLGAKALKAICLLSHQPYLASSDKVLRELFRMAFVQGCTVPLPELISSLLAVPCPQPGGPKVCVRLGSSQVLLWPRMAVGPPPGEVPLRPLVEALGPDSLVGLFAAVLLEQRVLLRSQQHWRLTVVAEGLLRLLHPLRYHYVYIPVLPEGLREFVQAPTPFLMGLHSGQELDPSDCEALVVADLDSGSLGFGRDDSLMKRSLGHPYMQQLQLRVRMLLQPSLTETDAVGQSNDPWLRVAEQASAQPWGPRKQALLLQLFMEFFRCVLSDYQLFVSQQLAGRASSSSSIASGSQAGAGAGALSLQHQHSGAMLVAALGGGTTGGGSVSGLTKMRSVGRLPRHHQHSPSLDLKALLEHHHTHCRHSDSALLQQIVQGQLFLTFAAENSAADDPGGWLRTAQAALQAGREAEDSLRAAAAAFPGDPAQFFGSSIERVVIPSRPPGRLLPPGGLLYSCFPPLVLLEACGAGDGAASMRLRRRISTSGKKRPSTGKRRAISELMGSQVDLRRSSQTQASINTDGPPRLRNQAEAAAAGGAATPPLPPGLSSLAKVSTSSNASTSSFSHDYSAEAGLVRRQTALLVQLMQPAPAPGAAVGTDELSSSDLEAARLLLCVQTGGNGWFLVSRMKEIITAGSSQCSASGSSAAEPSGRPSSTNAAGRQATAAAAGASDAASLSIIAAGPGQARTDSLTPAASAKNGTSSRAASTGRGAAAAAAAAGPSGRVTPSGGSITSSISRSQLPGALKMESMVNAASAMAIRITRTGSGARQKQATSSSGSSFTIQASPMGSSVAAGKPPNTAVQGLATVASADAPDAGDADCPGLQELLAVAGAGESVISNLCSSSGRPSSCSQQAAGPSPARSSLGNSKGRRSSNGAGGSGSGGCWWDWRVSSGAFQVLGDMLNSILDVAAYGEDYRAVLAVLELASLITCQPAPAGRRRSLLGCLAGSPVVAAEWLWAGAFGCAVTSLYLQAEELMNMKDVVACCLGTFARYVTGVGISGPSAWLLLMQLAVEHASRSGELEPAALMELRALLAQQDSLGHQERLGQLPWTVTRPAAAAAAGSTASSSSAGCAAGRLPEHLLAALKACGLEHISSDAAPAAAGAGSRDAAMSAAAAGWRRQQRLMASCGLIGADKLSVPLAEEGEEGLDDEAPGQTGDVFPAAQSSFSTVLLCRHYTMSTSAGGNGSSISSMNLLAAAPDRAEPLLATSLGLPCPNAAAAADHAAVIPAPGPASAAESTAASTIASPRQAAAPGGSLPPAAASASAGTAAASCHSPRQLALAAVASSSKLGCSKPSPRSEGTSPRRESPRDSRPKLNRQHTGKGYSSIARQATADSAGCSRQPQTPRPAAAGASVCSTPAAADGSCVRSAGSAADGTAAASAAAPTQGIQVASEGSSLAEPGALQWAAIHGRAVTAVAASNFVTVSVSLDGSLKVVNTAGSQLQLAASMSIPALQPAGNAAAAGVAAVVAAVPVLKLWQDGSRAAVGNARLQAVWVLDLQGAAASMELSGLGSSVSALQLLHRNRETLLVGLARPSSSCHALSSGSGAAAAYLWDLRRPRKPATSLDISLGAAAGTGGEAAAGAGAAGGGAAGPVAVLGLSVHEDGVLAAAGCRDGRGIVWDMRQPSTPLAVCTGHSGPVRQVRFLPAAAATTGNGVGVGSSWQQLLLTGSDDWTARLWDAGSGACSGVCVGHGGPVTAVQVAHGRAGTRLVTGAADGSVGVWGLAGELCSLRQQHWAPVQLLAQGVDTLVSGAADKTCCVHSLPDVLSCHLERPPPLLACQPRHSLVTSMGYDPVAELLCAGHRDGLVSVWNCSFSADDH